MGHFGPEMAIPSLISVFKELKISFESKLCSLA